MTPDGGQLTEITGFIEKGKAKAVVDCIRTFEEFQEAFERVDGGHARGEGCYSGERTEALI